jgi:hypothetical protein
MLLKKRKKAIHGLNTTQQHFDELCTPISEETRNRWLDEETTALAESDNYQIYDVDIEKGLCSIISISVVNNPCQ